MALEGRHEQEGIKRVFRKDGGEGRQDRRQEDDTSRTQRTRSESRSCSGAQTERGIAMRNRGDGRIFARKGTKLLWCQYSLRGKQYRESTGETDEQKAGKYL